MKNNPSNRKLQSPVDPDPVRPGRPGENSDCKIPSAAATRSRKIQSNSETAAAGSSLPCLNSNNYTESDLFTTDDLSPYQRKQAYSLVENCDRFVALVGIDHVGFLTLTFPDNVLEHSEALRRWNSLRTHFIEKHFGRWMLVKERQKRGAIHYHILIEVPFDLRTGFNFDEVFPPRGKRPSYRSACPQLRSLWKELREAMPKYGFGRPELAPIRSNGEAMAKYVGKYISKDQGQKNDKYADLDKGARRIAYSQNWCRSNSQFAWNTDGAKEWRRKVKFVATMLGCDSNYELGMKLGPKWAYNYGPAIMNLDMQEILERVEKEVPF